MSEPTHVVPTCLANGRPALAVLAKRAYRLVGSSLYPEKTGASIRQAPERGASENPSALEKLVHDTDLFCAAKPLCDLLVLGSAHASRGATPTLDTGVKLGDVRKIVRVWGQRRIRVEAGGRLRFSEPEPFSSAPLGWDAAYGGRDLAAEKRLFPAAKRPFARAHSHGAVAYPRNPAGRGFFIDMDRDRLDGTVAPSQEDPEDPVTPDRLLATSPEDWLDRPVAAGYGAVELLQFPRVACFAMPAHVTPKRPVREVRAGVLTAEDLGPRDPLVPRLDLRAAQCASPGLALAIARKTRLSLWNLWPGREIVEMDLPPEAPELLLEPPGCNAASLPPGLRTVLIEPNEGRVSLVWAGTLEVAAPFQVEACREMRRAARWQMK